VSTQVPPQSVKPGRHVTAHCPPVQLAIPLRVLHAEPHAPQFFGSVARFAQRSVQRVSGGEHAATQPLGEQRPLAPEQCTEPPHVAGLDGSASQPSRGSLLQSAQPGWQPWGTTHAVDALLPPITQPGAPHPYEGSCAEHSGRCKRFDLPRIRPHRGSQNPLRRCLHRGRDARRRPLARRPSTSCRSRSRFRFQRRRTITHHPSKRRRNRNRFRRAIDLKSCRLPSPMSAIVGEARHARRTRWPAPS
jgi:hypothetical protein